MQKIRTNGRTKEKKVENKKQVMVCLCYAKFILVNVARQLHKYGY